MKKEGILHSGLLKLIASAGHGDLIVISDRGFPLPTSGSGIKVIDLGISEGLPSFPEVTALVAKELAVEVIIHAEESLNHCSEYMADVKELFCEELPCTIVPHSRFKAAIISNIDGEFGRIIGFIRTGEFTSYANVMFRCGVVF